MKVAILAGGKGTRIHEESCNKPKPMIEIGGKPILLHIMKHYATQGFREFVIALGYKGEVIKDYFSQHDFPDWNINLVDTGEETSTGGRIKRLAEHLGNETFMLTWGDGVSNIELYKLLEFHKSHGKLATLTAVRPPPRFGHVDINKDKVVSFYEKPQYQEGWINGAFFVLEPKVLDYIEGDSTMFEEGPLENLAKDEQLMAFKHEGFWRCMDTEKDKEALENIWASGHAPWKIWND